MVKPQRALFWFGMNCCQQRLIKAALGERFPRSKKVQELPQAMKTMKISARAATLFYEIWSYQAPIPCSVP